ncbi:MAG: transglutaminase-like domain-containing protein, partial [Urechidicola sp.]|nr:transglutaminase-like domain-containing protein [Urechidicola sp.]
MKVPMMRTLVIPSSYKNQPTNYMNDWYYKKVSQKKGLNNSAKRKIDQLTKGVTDPMQLVKIIYSYVKSNYKYVAIEIGMGAFIPTHVNEVYLNKQGDCKDLSNFLSEVLNYKGIKSDIALAATFDHISNCDFPSLSSANHVICIVYINDKVVLLDPTDPIHFEETPIQSLQDRSILIVNSEGGLFFEVEGFSPEQNRINYQMNLKIDSNNILLEGAFEIKYRGISGNFLQRELKRLSNKEFENFGEILYEEIFGNQSISDLAISNDLNEVTVEGEISINGKTFKDGPNQYLFLDFIPRLMETESRETLLEGTYLRNPFHKNVHIKIEMNEPIEKFEIIEHSYIEEGVSLHLKVSAVSDHVIECTYNFV